MITADAFAVTALSTLTAKSHAPRWISAMLPGVNPSKSLASQPAVEPGSAGGGNRLSLTSCSGAVTSPVAE